MKNTARKPAQNTTNLTSLAFFAPFASLREKFAVILPLQLSVYCCRKSRGSGMKE